VHEAGGVTFGFLGLDMTARSDMLSDNELWVVRKSSERVDNLIVSVHWGIEYQVQPTSLQRKWARQLVENGADVVWGHHPHVVGEVGYIQQKPIFYSLGNFVFDQMWSEKTKRGMVVELTFEGENLVGEKREEVYMQQWARPAWQ
jgi:poly-gamma-glutamate synthesis protein (capsule biosynthesis protein)